MKRLLCSSVLLTVGLWGSFPARASQAVRLGLEELVQGAKRIVVVRSLGASHTFTSPDKKRIFTRFDFEVEEELAGSGPQGFSIVQPGGTFGRVRQKTWGYQEFKSGERLLLFLEDSANGPRVMGVGQGVFVRQVGKGGDFWQQRLEGLRFPGDPGKPLRITPVELRECIRRHFSDREVSQ